MAFETDRRSLAGLAVGALLAIKEIASGSTPAKAQETSTILDVNTLTFNERLLAGNAELIRQNAAMRAEVLSTVPANLRPSYIAHIGQLNLETPPALKPFAELAQKHRVFMLDMHIALKSKVQTVFDTPVVTGFSGTQGSDFVDIANIWTQRGYKIVVQPEMGPQGNFGGIIFLKNGGQPCVRIITDGTDTIVKPQCQISIPVDNDERNAARLWLMLVYLNEANARDVAQFSIIDDPRSPGEKAVVCRFQNPFLRKSSGLPTEANALAIFEAGKSGVERFRECVPSSFEISAAGIKYSPVLKDKYTPKRDHPLEGLLVPRGKLHLFERY